MHEPLKPLPTITYPQTRHSAVVYTATNLPKPSASWRWTPGRKELFVRAVEGDLLTREDFLRRYNVAPHDFDQWCTSVRSKRRPSIGNVRLEHAQNALAEVPPAEIHQLAPRYEIGKVRIHVKECTAEVAGTCIHLTKQEWKVLLLLLAHRGSVVSKRVFFDALYGAEEGPSLKAVDVLVCKLRLKLFRKTGEPCFVETVWGQGYMIP